MQYILHASYINETEAREQSLSLYCLVVLVRQLQTYYTPVLIFIGLISNAICVLTLLATKLRKRPSSVYLAAICVNDALFLSVLFLTWLKTFGLDLMNTGGWCQAIKYFSSITAFLSLWNMVALTMDRVIYLCFPHKRGSMCTATRAKIVTIGLCIGAIPIYLNMSILSGIMNTYFGPMCVPLPQFNTPFQILMKMDIAFNVFLPYFTLLVQVLVITVKLVTTRQQRLATAKPQQEEEAAENGSRMRMSGENQSAVLVIWVTCLFMVLSMPSYSIQLWVFFKSFMSSMYRANKQTMLWQQVLLYLFYTRCALNLFACIFVSRSFRSALVKLFHLLKARMRKPRASCDIEDNSLHDALNPNAPANDKTTAAAI